MCDDDETPKDAPPIDATPVKKIALGVMNSGWLDLIAIPVDYFKQQVIPRLRSPEYPYYHRKYKRVATVDECKSDDHMCIYEADKQYMRDRHVDIHILDILRRKEKECKYYWKPDHEFKCDAEITARIEAERNWEIKHGDQGINAGALNAFYKQKHRMVFERRHGPIGYGKKPPSQWKKEWDPSLHSANYVPLDD